ncbi:GntR family transcriptional regulator [Paeniglutamicibacter cryotolerans]|uniref:DNA-binding GntR family transcriptional regulator n=1 Tax=Paeniglutamicibacter cryotolerans TaxID=670079 RepID=A0A839QQQ1_9MICC|nr:GntR family transcriptional regulator [Paeniglutamicibacter cryotolerans]MBB2995582.1 DNA-binding GntR family transcriptional regulator [Paeniglutamicibacter cryotolerans]
MDNFPIQPIHLRLTGELRGQIQDGRFTEGGSFPSEAELCMATGASRGTVRRALSVFRAEGLITGGRGKVPVVSRPVPSQPFATFMSFTEWALATGSVPGQRTLEVALRPASEEIAT